MPRDDPPSNRAARAGWFRAAATAANPDNPNACYRRLRVSEPRILLVEGDHALLEADFVGRQIQEFAGRPPTGKALRVPYTVVYDLTPDGISALRIYGFMDVLLRQLDSPDGA